MPNTITDTIAELANNKADIQDALVAKGVTSAGKHGFNKFAEDISAISTSEQIIRVAGTDKNSWSEEGYSNIMLNTGDTAETYINYWT